MENEDFAVFILSHGRPNNVKTFKLLKKRGYSGKIYLIIDNEDKTADQYVRNFGSAIVKVFDKKAMADKVDEGNNFDNRKVILHARNYCFELAKELNITYFVQFDDDYNGFGYRYFEGEKIINNLDKIFSLTLDYYKSCNIKSICFSQGGDHIGGFGGIKLKRKAMNSFFCSTERPFNFIGSINEDVNTYTTLGSRGELFFTLTNIILHQAATQGSTGGMTDLYLDSGTYVKSFHSVMMQPSSVKIKMMYGVKNIRLHHSIKWKHTTPLIINEKYKKNGRLD